jgi:four helix bundle protein
MASAKRLEDLVVWQLACQLRDGIGAALLVGTGARDWNFRGQIERSSRSVTANIAEGFGYFKPRPFAKYLRIARASAMETQSHIVEGRTRKHFSPAEAKHFYRLSSRVLGGVSRLIGISIRATPTWIYILLISPTVNPEPRTPNPEPGTRNHEP